MATPELPSGQNTRTNHSAQSTEPAPQAGPRPPRAFDIALRVLVRVEEGAYATLALSGEVERSRLDGKGRALCTELVYGTLRRALRLDRALAALAPRGLGKIDPLTRSVLRLAAYGLLFTRSPKPAVVNDAVNSITRQRGRGLGGFVNALLRRLAAQGEPPLPPLPPDVQGAEVSKLVAPLAVLHALPEWLVEDALRRLPRTEALALLKALDEPAPTWVRLNPLRGPLTDGLAALSAELPSPPRPHPALPEAVRLSGGHPFHGAAYASGWFLAQDLGAQLVARLLLADTEHGPLQLPAGALLDACAGVGGKTTHLCALTGNQRDVDAADLSARKLELCAEHAQRLGCTRVRTMVADLSRPDSKGPLRERYAAILLDAPCTGSGVLRRHPEARTRFARAQVGELAALQRRLLTALAPRLQPGGVLVYSVCSYLPEEGEAVIADFLRAHPEFERLPPDRRQGAFAEPGLVDADGALRTLPHRQDADGFFAVRLRRTR
ncbi:MAG: transcription antitermination factor NusB [Polyangia bacterium]